MPQIPFRVVCNYQNCEEILSTTFYYLWDEPSLSDVGLSQLICKDLALSFYARRATFALLLPTDARFVSIETHAPVVDGVGPAGYAINVDVPGGRSVTRLTDMICAVVNLSGNNELDEPVRNAKLLSMLGDEDVDCNQVSSTVVQTFSTQLANFLPSNLALSNGNLVHVVRNFRAGIGVITYHPVLSIQCSSVPGSYGTRRGDVTPRKGKIVQTP